LITIAFSLLLTPRNLAEEARSVEDVPCYSRGESLQTTLLQTRARYRRWQQEQSDARRAVTLGPWLAMDLWRLAPAVISFQPEADVDLTAKDKDGQPLWFPRDAWQDGTIVTVAPTANSFQAAQVFLTREIRATHPVTLSCGIGGGDRIEIWLNRKKILSADTALTLQRYGTSMRVEGSRVDQTLCDLKLLEGANRLTIRVAQQRADRQVPMQFYFSASPDPAAKLWACVEGDFPRRENRLLAAVDYRWFEVAGWYAAEDTRLEQELAEAMLDRIGAPAATLKERFETLRSSASGSEDPGWLDLCVTLAELQAATQDLDRLQQAVDALACQFGEAYSGESHVREIKHLRERLIRQASGRLDPRHPASQQLLGEIQARRQEWLVQRNPLLAGQRMMLVKRFTYDSQHYYDDFYNGIRRFGGMLCELSLDDGSVRAVVPQLAGGIFDRYDLAFDGDRIVFGYRPPRPEGFRIWEARLDGSGLSQLTFPPADEEDRICRNSLYSPQTLQQNPQLYGHWSDDMHPCYLPDGGIAFVSSRPEHSVLCGGHSLTCTALFRIDGGGNDPRKLSFGALSEFTPTMLDDGRLLYNRWEYVYKGIAAIQPLWTMRLDGSGSEEIYGDNIANPGVFVQARQVPGRPDLVVATGCGHEPLAVGTIVLLDRHEDKRTPAAITFLTPDTNVQGLRGLYQRRNGRWNRDDVYGPFYCDPYPLSDKFFLVSCNPDRRYNDESAYGIYLLDVFGNLLPVYRDPEISCWQPTLVQPRRRPPVIGDPAPATEEATEATLLVSDIYRGLPGVEPGTVKYLRVMEQIPRSWAATLNRAIDSIPGQQPAISYHTHIWVAVLLGIVPVEPDGSAYFRVPADRNLFFQALDENFLEVQKMRTFINLRSGETRACIGCHEHRAQAPVSRSLTALQYPPRNLEPQPGEVAPRPIDYATDVQPVLDRHCVSCHGGAEPDGDLDLSGELTTHFNRSYENLIQGGYVNFIQEWTGPRLENPPEYFTVGGSMAHAEAVPPYTYGSHASRVIRILLEGHYDVDMPPTDLIRLATWVDANAPYYGSYFGRRHIQFRGRPDFRPVPTVASARGVPPAPYRPEPIPAELIAWWRLDERQGDRAVDASGAENHAMVTRAAWGPARVAGGIRLDGNGYVQAPELGTFDAASVALWVRPESLNNRWNPLLFTDDRVTGAFHFSLLQDGVPNVAINAGNESWVHNRALAAIPNETWHHVAVVCDTRYGGRITFYVDGRRDAEATLDIGVPLDWSHFRVGAWNAWQGNPHNNFHGMLDEVRIYRGMLTASQVAELAAWEQTAADDKLEKED